MRHMNSFILLLSFHLIVPFAIAGDFRGNGGGGVLCPGKSLEILDFYEASEQGLPAPNLGTQQTLPALSEVYLSRLSFYSPFRAEMYRAWAKSFEAEAVFLDNIPIDPIDDLGSSLPAECRWLQIINQNPLLLPTGKKYLIDRNLWSQLSNIQKVGLIFHEILYRETNSKTSAGLRRLNANIATDTLRTMSITNRVSLFVSAGFSWMEHNGLTLRLDENLKIIDDVIRTATCVENSKFNWGSQSLKTHPSAVEFYETGSVKSLYLNENLKFRNKNQLLEFSTRRYSNLPIQFYENGKLKEGPLVHSRIWLMITDSLELQYGYLTLDQAGNTLSINQVNGTITIDKQIYRIDSNSLVNFHPNGTVKSFLWGQNKLATFENQYIYPRIGSKITLFADGRIQSFVTSQDGHIRVSDKKWITFKKGETIKFTP